jgi:hypothetical protein
MSSEIFQSPEWFQNLWKNGFEKRPMQCWSWKVKATETCTDINLLLMQDVFGDGLSSLSNYYSCLFGPEISESSSLRSDEQHWSSAIKVLRGIPGSHVIRLQPIDSENKWFETLEKKFRTNGFITKKFFCFGNWYQQVPQEGFEKYWRERPSALSNTVRRGKSRLNNAGDWHIEIHSSCKNLEELEEAIRAYEKVYAGSWKNPEPCKEFIPGLMRLAASKGWLRLGVLWLNNAPLAAQLWLTTHDKANIYKLAYIKGFEKLSAGSVLTAAMMEHAMDVDKVKEVDYLSGDDAYKADWMACRRERVGLIAIDMKNPKGCFVAAKIILKSCRSILKKNFLKIIRN